MSIDTMHAVIAANLSAALSSYIISLGHMNEWGRRISIRQFMTRLVIGNLVVWVCVFLALKP